MAEVLLQFCLWAEAGVSFLTSQPNPELGPAPPAGCGWVDTPWMPWEFPTAFGAGLYESQTKAPMPLTLPLLCIFHCFLFSSAALVFASRGRFLHSAEMSNSICSCKQINQ